MYQINMDLEQAKQIWKGSDMSEAELVEWVRMVNQRERNAFIDKEHLGETIEVSSSQQVSHSNK